MICKSKLVSDKAQHRQKALSDPFLIRAKNSSYVKIKIFTAATCTIKLRCCFSGSFCTLVLSNKLWFNANGLKSDSTFNVILILVGSATWFSRDSGIMSNKVLVLRLVCVDEEVHERHDWSPPYVQFQQKTLSPYEEPCMIHMAIW